MTLLFLPALYALWFRVKREPREARGAHGAEPASLPAGT